ADGQELGFANALRLDIAGVGTLTLRSNRPAEADQGIAQAATRHSQLLTSLGVDSLATAQQRQADAQQKSAELELARQRLADLAPQGIAQLQADIALLAEASAGDLELKGDLAQLRQAHARSEEHTSELQSRENLVCRL